MAKYSNVQTDFSGGLISDYILGRLDIKRVANSARTFKNFFPSLQGPAVFRTGFKYVNELTADDNKSVSIDLVVATDKAYRVVFGNQTASVYNSKGELLDTLDTPYSNAELGDLRFSSETDALYITHGSYYPKKLSADIVFVSTTLQADNNGVIDTLLSSDLLTLNANIEIQGDTNWTLEDMDIKVEPFLETDQSEIKYSISQSERYVKLTTTGPDFVDIVNAGSPAWLDYYVEYNIGDEKFLGKIVDAATSTNYTLADPTSQEVFVSPVDTVLDIEDAGAQLFLLDNRETTEDFDVLSLTATGLADGTYSEIIAGQSLEFTALADVLTVTNNISIKLDEAVVSFVTDTITVSVIYQSIKAQDVESVAILEQEGVKVNEIELRSDTTIFNSGQVGAWVRVADDRRSNDVAVGNNRTNVRWVQISEHVGTEDHPVNFFRGTTAFNNNKYQAGSVYKTLSTQPQYFSKGPDQAGSINVVVGIQASGGNRTIPFNTFLSTSGGSTNVAVAGIATSVVANLSTSKQFDVCQCYNTNKVEQGTNLIIPATSSQLTIEPIANDVTVSTDKAAFAAADVGRNINGELPSGNVYLKIVRFIDQSRVIAELNNPVPRDKRTLGFENEGRFESVKLGAWFVGNYPRTTSKYEQRRIFGGTYDAGNVLYFSRSDDDQSFQPTQNDGTVLDTDAITYNLSNTTASIRWLSSGRDLVIGTSGGIYRVVPNQYQSSISPKTIRIELTEEEPCEDQAEIVGSSVFYPDQSGTRLMEYKFDLNIQNSSSNDVSKLIYPVFLTDPIVRVAYQHTPQPRIWVLTTSGKLYCLSYHRQEEFYAWSQQETNGAVKDISILHKSSATNLDTLWIIIERNGRIFTESLSETDPVQLLEYTMLDSFIEVDIPDYIKTKFVRPDPQFTYFRPDATSVYNNFYDTQWILVAPKFLDGDVVSVVQDGVFIGTRTVNNGYIYIHNASTTKKIIVGYSYVGELKMMFPTWDGSDKPAYGSDNARIISIRPFLINSFSYSVGVKETFALNKVASTYEVGDGFTGFDREQVVAGSHYGVDNVPTIRHTEPYPLTLASLTTKTDLN
tara:strand:- start:475 stop:3699 length:3225 start_codon:yes stop_codon:yes gene_type:complete